MTEGGEEGFLRWTLLLDTITVMVGVSANLVKVTKLGQSMVGAISHPKAWANMVILAGELQI